MIGDLKAPNLGMVPEMRAKLIQEVDVIISSAASVDFSESLHEMLTVDYFGPIKML